MTEGTTPIASHRAARRLVVALLALIVFDRAIPSRLASLEQARYENGGPFRFENSDLFGLRPLVSYLREHPHSDRRRVLFLGNSIVFGYGVAAADAVPAAFERMRPGTRVFNAAVNGSFNGSEYLMAKAMIDSVDHVYLQSTDEGTLGILAKLLPVDDADVQRFNLQPSNAVETALERQLSRVSNLYASNERIQAALFGTSARQYVYLNKKQIVRQLLRRDQALVTPPPEPGQHALSWLVPVVLDETRLSNWRVRRVLNRLVPFAELAHSRHKHITVIQFERADRPVERTAFAQFNRMYAPYADAIILTVPRELTYDKAHLTRAGAAAAARALAEYDARIAR